MRLYYSPNSSAALRVVLFIKLAGVRNVTLVKVEIGDVRQLTAKGGSQWRLPKNDPEAVRLGSLDYRAFNPEGRVPVLLVDGRQLTQSGAIISFLSSATTSGLIPTDPWSKAVMQQFVDIIACDIHPLQNSPMLFQAIREFGLVKHNLYTHPFRRNYIERGFHALEQLLAKRVDDDATTRFFSLGPEPTLADVYLVPQIRNGLGCGIDLAVEYPLLHRVWLNCLAIPEIYDTLIEAGGLAQPNGSPAPGTASLPSARPAAAALNAHL